MSRDWLLATLVLLGHAGVLVYLVNIVHALGFTDRALGRVKRLMLPTVLAVTAATTYEVAHGGWSTWTWPFRAYAAVCLGVIVVGVPVSSFWMRFRKKPEGILERTEEVDLAAPQGVGPLVGSGSHAWLLKIRGNEAFRLRKREWHLGLPQVPATWDGLSVVHLTDLHFAPCFEREYFERVIDEAAAWDGDLVVFTGDLIDHDEALDWIVPVMSRLRGRLGSYAILGNHDYNHDPLQIRRRLEEAGFTDLEGRWARLEIQGATLAVGGTSSPWGPELALDSADDAAFRLLLSHSPDLFYRAADAGIDLMLSGHNHGGQIRLPGLGPVFMPSRYSRRFDRGYFRSGSTLLHVSQGVAGKHPIRIGCVPEISRFVLRAAQGHNASTATSSRSRRHGEPARSFSEF